MDSSNGKGDQLVYSYYYGYEPGKDIIHKFELKTPIPGSELFSLLANLNCSPRAYGIIYFYSHVEDIT